VDRKDETPPLPPSPTPAAPDHSWEGYLKQRLNEIDREDADF
jgi:hypothetical protein